MTGTDLIEDIVNDLMANKGKEFFNKVSYVDGDICINVEQNDVVRRYLVDNGENGRFWAGTVAKTV
ncbi:MAG: hypothetical protein OQK12_07045 [Motiliproteus sp.]|nr:hypothetical protein [Motiliproteus sp.]MCW9052345.1 hypothetical protein [Motiliproteus sp.]